MTRAIVGLLGLLTAAPQIVTGQTHITAAANVRLRSAPDTSSAVVAMLRLGTELELGEAPRQGEWIPVRTHNGAEGWVAEMLTVPVSDSTYPSVVRDLVISRLDRERDGYVAKAELLAFIESALDREWPLEDQAWLELQRLRTLYAALQTLPFNRNRWSDDQRAWVERRSNGIRYNEPGGHWLIEREVVLDVHDRYQFTLAADDLAWFMVQNGLPGECEGYLVCYLERSDQSEGEYLRRHPDGRYVEEALARAKRVVGYYEDGMKPQDYLDPQKECAALNAVIDSLEAAVRSSDARDRVAVATDLRGMLRLCSG